MSSSGLSAIVERLAMRVRKLEGLDHAKLIYVQATDPGAVGAGVLWFDTSAGAPYLIQVRDPTNTSWTVLRLV